MEMLYMRYLMVRVLFDSIKVLFVWMVKLGNFGVFIGN